MANPQLPKQFGKYVLTRKIALGGMAEIYKAKTAGAEGFEKDVVIKRILPHFTEDENFVKMFIDEASITSKLQHANIVQIFDFDVCEGSYYIAMEYIEGVDLKKVIDVGVKQGTPLSVAQCAWILMELSKGLHYAHVKEHKGKPLNIVHRDISPHNAMVSYNGEVKLMDFGIAKAAQRSTKTMAGTVKGKVAYMSPEQARGKPIDGRSDLFALGIMMWEMLTGKRLFLGDSDFETLTNVLKSEAPPPSSLNPDVPPELDAIVLKTLEKNRDKRHANVEEFGRELTRWYYSSVSDLEGEALKPFVQTLFAADIEKVKALSASERSLPSPGRTADAEASPADADRTMALPASEVDPHAAATLLDDGSISQQQIQEALAKQSAERTMAMPAGQGTGTIGQTGQIGGTYGDMVEEKKGKGLLIAIAAIIFLAAGGVAAYFFLNKDEAPPANVIPDEQGEEKPKVETAELIIKVTPHTAEVTVDGDAAEGSATSEIGESVRVVAVAEGYDRFEEIVKVKEDGQVVEIEMDKTAVEVTVVLQATGDDKATFKVNGKDMGAGPIPVKCTAGESIEVVATPSKEGGKAVTEKFTCSEDNTQLKIAVELPITTGTLTIDVSPSGASVTATGHKVTMSSGGAKATIADVPLNAAIALSVAKRGYVTKRETITLTSEKQRHSITLAKRAAAPTTSETTPTAGGTGKLSVQAKPWAQVTVDGKPVGTTPRTLTLKAGRHKVVLMKGTQAKTKVVTVKSGKTAKVYHDFTAP